jgi:hypothetical protein
MKRFALVTCLAACLVLALGAPAGAVNQIKVGSGSVGQGGNINVGVFIDNDVIIKSWVAPLIVREITAGSFVTNMTLTVTNGASSQSAFLTGLGVGNTYDALNTGGGTPGCPAGAGFGPAAPFDYVSPDGILFNRASVFPATPQPVSSGEGEGIPISIIHMTVTNTPGFFEVDSCCVESANHPQFVDNANQAITPTNGNLIFVKGTIEILANQCPTITLNGAALNATAGVQASRTATAVDAEGNPYQFFKVSGPGSVNAATGEWTWTPACTDVPGPHTVTIEASDKPLGAPAAGGCVGNLASVASFDVNVAPIPLSLNCGADVSVHWGALAQKAVGAIGGCPGLIWEVTDGPGSVNGSGMWSYQTGCGDVPLSPQMVTIEAEDATGQIASCSFDLTVGNTAPTCTDPADITAPTGAPQNVNLGPLVDADGDALTYTQTSGPAWGAVVGNEWQGTRPGGDDAVYTVCFEVSDNCAPPVECCFDVLFESAYIVCIKGTVYDDEGNESDPVTGLENYSEAFGGQNKEVCIWVDPATGSSGLEGGFDFLICYDASALSFISASRGGGLDPTWEYFTYRTGMFGGNCGGPCPNGFVRIVGIADMNNGIAPDADAFNLEGCIATLTFFVSGDQNFVGSCPHVGFCSYDCGDNVISSKDGNTLFIFSSGVTLGPDYVVAECMEGGGPNKPTPERFINFCPGAICIIPPPDDRGDINFNGLPNEIGDAVLFSNYFMQGSSVFTVNPAGQAFATDVNNDGLTLTVADLVYLIRIITGDAQPFPDQNINPKVAPYASNVDVTTEVRNGALTIRTNAAVELGGALLVYRYSDLTVGEAALTAGSGLKMKSVAHNGELRVLIYPDMASSGGRVNAGSNTLVTIPVSGEGTIELVESQFSDADGGLMSAELLKSVLPTQFALHQNFPNPFNAGTVIPVDLKSHSEYSLTIYNVAGQVVRTFAGELGEGTHNISWDGRANNGSEVPSGMYFYRLNLKEEGFTATKKMVLIK